MLKLLAGLFAALSFSTMALAQSEAVKLEGDVKLERAYVENGASKIVLVEPSIVVPGDRLIFSTRYINSGKQSVENFVVTNPLPQAIVLAPESASKLSVSVDGSKSFGPLASLTLPDGKGGTRKALAADVTHVRWTLPNLAPGASGALEYHANVR